MRNNVALENRSEFGQKRLKKPENSPFLLGIAVHSDLRGGSMSPRLFLQQNTVQPDFYHRSSNCRILRSLAWLAYLVVLLLKSPHRAFLGLTRAEKKNIYESAAIRSFFDYAYQLLRSDIAILLYLSSFLLVISCSLQSSYG